MRPFAELIDKVELLGLITASMHEKASSGDIDGALDFLALRQELIDSFAGVDWDGLSRTDFDGKENVLERLRSALDDLFRTESSLLSLISKEMDLMAEKAKELRLARRTLSAYKVVSDEAPPAKVIDFKD